MTSVFDGDEAATLLHDDEKQDLIPTWITTRDELNIVEQEGILEAISWLARQSKKEVLTELIIRQLHKKMFQNVWRWAGQFRVTDKNIGVPHWKITEELRKLLDDVKAQITYQSYSSDEIAARFHHRLVAIHPFPNGNGRFARLMTDLLLKQLGRPAFTWGGGNLANVSEARKRYIEALRKADAGQYSHLLLFVRR